MTNANRSVMQSRLAHYLVTLVVLGAHVVGFEAAVTVTLHRGVEHAKLDACFRDTGLEGTPGLHQPRCGVAL